MARPQFEAWRLELAPGQRLPSTALEWADALVLVERGLIEVECETGLRRTFRSGDLVVLAWLSLLSLANPGPGVVRLLAVRRRTSVWAGPIGCGP